jgi:hypothetical protein
MGVLQKLYWDAFFSFHPQTGVIVKRVLVLVTLVAGVSTAQAQSSWRPQFGIQGGFTRTVAAGSGADPGDAISLPALNIGNVLPAPGGLYAIFPWSRKLAVETDFAFSQASLGATLTFLGLGLRGDYALTKNLYAAAGGSLAYNNGFANETQLGVQAALGYRFQLTRTLNARFEGRTTFYGKSDNIEPQDVYSALFGVSTVIGGGAPTRNTARAASQRAWRPQIGIAGGYTDAHLVGLGSLTSVALPGFGGGFGTAVGGLAAAAALPPTLFAIIPVGKKVALEPGLDIHRFQGNGQTDFSGNLSARLDYAVHGGWYGALGGNLHYLKSTGVDAATRTGVNIAWGYRFPLVMGLAGRFEANYTWYGENTDLALPPTNVLGLMFGAAMPLK